MPSLSLLSVFNELIISLIPIIKKVIEAIVFNITSGTNVDIEPPVKAPIKLAITNADDDPRNTANGLFDVPLIVKVTN